MNTISMEDVNYLAQQSSGRVNMILSGMTALMNDTYKKAESMQSQNWFQRMLKTVTGKNKATNEEIRQNHDKLNAYMSEAIAELYSRDCIDHKVMLSLGTQINELYADHLQLKQILGSFASRLNEKIESVDNFHMLTTEIEQGVYSGFRPVIAICMVMSQFDNRMYEDTRKLDIIKRSLHTQQILTDDAYLITDYLMDILEMPVDEMGAVYLELSTIRQDFMAAILLEAAESYHFLPDMARKMKNKKALIDNIMMQEGLDATVSLSTNEIYDSFISSKIDVKNDLVSIPAIPDAPETYSNPEPEDKVAAKCSPEADTRSVLSPKASRQNIRCHANRIADTIQKDELKEYNKLQTPRYKRTKDHCNIGVIGHINHGKTTLTAAITAVLAARVFGNTAVDFYDLDKTTKEMVCGITISTTTIEYETEERHYAHIDCHGHADYVKNMIAGTEQIDGAILVVAATDGVMAQTKEHIWLSRQTGISHIVVFMNKCDMIDDEDLLELVEMEIIECLEKYGFYDCPLIKGSALEALEAPWGRGGDAVMDLMEVIDAYIPTPQHIVNRPFFMPIEDIFTIHDQDDEDVIIGTVATGRVERGILRLHDEIEIAGFRDYPLNTTVHGIEMFHKLLDKAQPGDNIGVLMRNIQPGEITRGQVLAAPDTIAAYSRFTALVYFLCKDEGGRHTPFFNNYRLLFYFRTADVTGNITLPEGLEMCMPGDNMEMTIELIHPVVIEPGLTFSIRKGDRTVGCGRVVSIIR